MEKIKLFIIVSVAVLSAFVVGVILFNISKDDTAGVIKDVEQTIQNGQNSSEPAIGEVSVTIQNHAYGPSRLTVKKGTTVTWTNRDAVEHDVTPDTPRAVFKQSQLLGRGDRYSVTFTDIGTYTYHCSPHPEMTGIIEVVE